MKFLLAIAALSAIASAFPFDGNRAKRGVFGYGGYSDHNGYGAVVKGPSGVIAANVGHGAAGPAVITAPAHAPAVVSAPSPVAAVFGGPSHGYAGHGHHGTASISAPPQVAGVVNAPSATVIGPSTDGHPGAIIPKGYTGAYGFGGGFHGFSHGGYHGGYWG